MKIGEAPPRDAFNMGADGSRRRSSAASHEALPLGRPHGPYEICLPFKGFGRARTSDLVWSRRLTVLVVVWIFGPEYARRRAQT